MANRWPCVCGKPGWVEVDGRYPCRECYLKLRGREVILEFEQPIHYITPSKLEAK